MMDRAHVGMYVAQPNLPGLAVGFVSWDDAFWRVNVCRDKGSLQEGLNCNDWA